MLAVEGAGIMMVRMERRGFCSIFCLSFLEDDDDEEEDDAEEEEERLCSAASIS